MNICKTCSDKTNLIFQGSKDKNSFFSEIDKIKQMSGMSVSNAINAKIFAVSINEKTETGYEVLNIVFDMSYAWATYFKSKIPWKEPFSNRYSVPTSGIMEITESFRKEIIQCPEFRTALEDYIKSQAKINADQIISKAMQKLSALKIDKNNNVFQRIESDRKSTESWQRLFNYAEQKAGSRKYQFYSEYYRGPNAPAHDDDYEGSGSVSIKTIVRNTNANTEEKVDKLIAELDRGTGIYIEKDRIRTVYRLK